MNWGSGKSFKIELGKCWGSGGYPYPYTNPNPKTQPPLLLGRGALRPLRGLGKGSG